MNFYETFIKKGLLAESAQGIFDDWQFEFSSVHSHTEPKLHHLAESGSRKKQGFDIDSLIQLCRD